MNQALNIFQIILGLLLVGLVLLQSKGTGLGSVGGDFSFYGTKRGAEKMLFITTIIVSTLFIICSLVGVMLS